VDSIAEGIWLTGELLKPDERTRLLALSRENGYRGARMKSHGRHNRESFLWLPDIAQGIAFRLNSEIRKEKLVAFRISEMSSTLQCYLYQQGDRVAPHRDGSSHVRNGKWSVLTLVIYLNDEFTGGTTGFPELRIELSAPAGHGLLFKQQLLHEGTRVVTGEKYIVRTDVATVC